MDDTRFDRLTRAVGALTSRRAALRAAVGSALGALGLAAADAKKKKKCKKPKVKCGKKCCAAGLRCINGRCATPPPAEECQITKTATLWTLEADCTITKTIQIPNGVTFDGNDKTITLTGNVESLTLNLPDNWLSQCAVLANEGTANVHDLTIRASNLTGTCGPLLFPEGLAFINASGEIRNVTVEDISLAGNGPCGNGITATGTGGQTVSMEDVSVSGCPGIDIWGLTRKDTVGITVNIDGATVVTDAAGPASSTGIFPTGILFSGGRIAGTIANADVTMNQGLTGIAVSGRGTMTGQVVNVTDATVLTASRGISGGILTDGTQIGTFTVNVTRADVTCTGDPETSADDGILYFSGNGAIVSGTVDDCVVRGATFAGVDIDGNGLVAVKNSTVEDSYIGIYAAADVDAQDNTITRCLAGIVVDAVGNLTSNTILGRGENSDLSYGIVFSPSGASGSVEDNTISNYFDSNPDTTSCGIGVFEGAGTVNFGDNDFPDPPGNEQDICLDIPIERQRRARGNGSEPFGIEAARGAAGRVPTELFVGSSGHDLIEKGGTRWHERDKRGRKGRRADPSAPTRLLTPSPSSIALEVELGSSAVAGGSS